MAQFCKVCDRLWAEYIAELHEAAVVLNTVIKAREAGIIDDIGFVAADAQLDEALTKVRDTRSAYGQHRQARHKD